MSCFRPVIWVFVINFLVINLGITTASGSTYPSNCFLKTNPSAVFEQAYSVDEFVIFYNLGGEHGLADRRDLNQNQIPDVIENIMIQLLTMRDALEFLGFRHPFEGMRYQHANAQKIYIRLSNIRGNGLAFDEAHQDLKTGECALLITLSNTLSAKNLTPAHELFHLYQYGYTMFKQAWFLEGTARWAEDVLRASLTYPQTDIPGTDEQLDTFFRQSYAALSVWNSLVKRVDDSGVVEFPEEILTRHYLDGEAVIGDQSVYGVDFMIELLKRLDELDSQISQQQDLSPFFWPEAFQREPAHNQLMWQVVLQIYQEKLNRLNEMPNEFLSFN